MRVTILMKHLKLSPERLRGQIFFKLLSETNIINVGYESRVSCKRTERDKGYGYFQPAL